MKENLEKRGPGKNIITILEKLSKGEMLTFSDIYKYIFILI